MTQPLHPAIDASLDYIPSEYGDIACYAAGRGEPVLLLHTINAAASAYEVKPIFTRLAASNRVFAVDLPGFGLSQRRKQNYSIELYTASIAHVIRTILDKSDADACHVLALSLTGEFAARVTRDFSEIVRSLALVTPTGFSRGADGLRDPEGSTREIGFLSALTGRPAVGRFLFRRLSRPAVIRYFLKKTFGRDEYDEGLAQYDELTTQQDGAEHAPLAFVSGRLFATDIRSVYEALTVPVWLAHGTKGDFRDFSEADWTAARANWTKTAYDTGALPHFEQAERFCADYRRFLEHSA